jgi:membrane protein
MVRQDRLWTRKFTDYLSVVLVGPVLVFTAFGVLASLESHTVVQYLLETQLFGSMLLWAAQLVPFFVLCGVFTFLYKFVPNTYVRVDSALVGGLSAAILWGVAGEAFAHFVAASAKYSAIYSSFAVLILFLLWLYAGWVIVLIGAQFSFFHQHPSAYQSRLLWQQGTPAFRERLVLNLLLILARQYLKGGAPVRAPDLARALSFPLSLVEEQLEQLVESGVIGMMQQPEGVTLIKPPELISITGILDAVRGGNQAAPRLPVGSRDPVEPVLRRRDEAVEQALAGCTLRSLALEEVNVTYEVPLAADTR